MEDSAIQAPIGTPQFFLPLIPRMAVRMRYVVGLLLLPLGYPSGSGLEGCTGHDAKGEYPRLV